MRRVCSLLFIALACGGDAPGDTDTEGGGARTFDLEDGTRVVVLPSGEAVVEIDGRETLRLTEHGPLARTFNERVEGVSGIQRFVRNNEVRIPLDTFEGADQHDGAVELHWSGDGRRATVHIAPASLDDPGGATAITLSLDEGSADSIALNVGCDAEGTFSGFGGQYNQTDQTGEAFPLWVNEQGIGRDPEVEESPPLLINGDEHTTYFPAPWYVDARGWGLLIDTVRRVEVDLCLDDPEVAWFELVERDAPLHGVLMHGPTPGEVVRQLGARVGRPATPPDWAFLPWIAAQGGRDPVLAEVDALEAAGIPFGALWVQDWTGIRMNLDGGFGVQYRWLPDTTLYPDLAGMIASIQARGHRFLGYANPFVPTNLDHWDDMEAMGLLLGSPDDPAAPYLHVAPNGLASQPDLTNEAARDYVKGFLRDMVTVYGMDGWMADFSEWVPLDANLADGTAAVDHHNVYPREWQRLTREVMDEVRPTGDWVMFARAGWPGVQEVAQIHWIGDQEADWSPHDGLPTVVPAMINLGLSGVPIVTHDIAGFSGGPSTKELWQRWTELGAFSPIMRTHEGANKLENWSWEKDAETTAHFRRFALIHEALAPELRDFAQDAGATSIPVVRHMMLEFPDDPMTWRLSDQFMLGDELLVAPVTTEGATSRDVYLPAGTWFHVWTGAEHEGPTTVSIDAPIGSPPVFSLGRDRADLRAIP